MKYGIFSDIGSNLESLEAILNFFSTKGIANSALICCGNIIGFGPNSKECVDRIMDVKPILVSGTIEYLLQNKNIMTSWGVECREMHEWLFDQLSPYHIAFLKNLEPVKVYNRSITIANSSLSGPTECMIQPNEFIKNFKFLNTNICFLGCNGFFEVFSENNGFENFSNKLEIQKNNRYFINVGSVGSPRADSQGLPDKSYKACCAIYDDENLTIEFFRVDYDVEVTIKKIQLNKSLPNRLVKFLQGI